MDNKKRVTMTLEKPNPLFERWLSEWKEDAKMRGSKSEHTFNCALNNLRKFPLPLRSGRDCLLLKGFGKKLCDMLDEKLTAHQRVEGNEVELNTSNVNVKKKQVSRKSTNYVPQKESGGYAILLALYELGIPLTKAETIQIAKDKSRVSFTKPDPGSRYTAWSSMRTLIQKQLVVKEGHPPKFRLTPEGQVLAKKILEDNNPSVVTSEATATNSDTVIINDIPISPPPKKPVETMVDNIIVTNGDLISMESEPKKPISKETNRKKGKAITKHASSSSITSTQSSIEEECFIFEPYSFDIILLVDTQETAGSNTDIEQDLLQRELQRLSVLYEVRHLSVGDYTWIGRHRLNNKELVLPYIVERKRLDDFAKSIKDGRYYEQKFRLEKSGIQNVTYLIEHYVGDKFAGLPATTLKQAAVNTAIHDGFYVKETSNVRHTAQYLVNLSKVIADNFISKTLVSCPKSDLVVISSEDDLVSLMTFKEFNKSSTKNKPLKVSELFLKMLLQIKGMSVDRAMAIVDKYPTPLCLRRAYIGNNTGEKLLSDVRFGNSRKSIGPVLSKIVYDLFTNEQFCS